MLRVAIVGCGKIADQHIAAIRRLDDCEVVALCDREILMAKQLGERFGVQACFSDVQTMFQKAGPEVVHLTTPPQGHFSLGMQCLEAGRHVYLEKPFTVTAAEAETLLKLAQRRDLRVTAGHNLQFTLEAIEMRRLIAGGFLGGRPVHLDSYFSYDLGDASYVGPLLASRTHWVRQLPGQLFHNILSHGIAKVAEFLDGEEVEVIARAHQSPKLRALGGAEVLDELRVLMRDRVGTTASFFFSTQIKPSLNLLRVCGLSNSLTVDYGNGSVIRNVAHSDKSYLTYVLPPLRSAWEQFRCARTNLKNIFKRTLHQDFGMKDLIGAFYESIRTAGPPPISYREILLTARIMDEIFAQVYPTSDAKHNEQATTVR